MDPNSLLIFFHKWQSCTSGNRRWLLVDGITIAKKIKTCGLPSAHDQIVDSVTSNWECPKCSYKIDECDESYDQWPGLPKGVKFDPTDVELLDHLAAKLGVGNDKPHEYLDVFIPTINIDQGICYTHPENLPGSRKDGNSFHFFYQTTNAYAKGQRKRRKISNRTTLKDDVRWHKTGKTKAIFKNGVQIGCKKILVLYGTVVGGSKPCKMKWVMHQYHLGNNEDEKEGEYVVSKIFYQAQKNIGEDTNYYVGVANEVYCDPTTPIIDASDPLRPGKTPLYEDITCDYAISSPVQESECIEQKHFVSISTDDHELTDDELNLPTYAEDINSDAFHHNSFSYQDNIMDVHYSLLGAGLYANDVATDHDTSLGTTELQDLDTHDHVNLAELYFPNEDSFCGSLDWL
ncbi:hypothetical protein QVD17_04622 [Tagetes erecta]|uniref:NAC domain-containing protein n=1 Tax=Tagetes erecta TaxID=13708 RepID=A0AAD8PAU6_TARER|nr:hypothetical protein QVD17_04622 [Tagetes erecta]